MKIESIALTDSEKALVERFARQNDMTLDDAATRLFSEGLATRVKRHTGASPSKNILAMRGLRK